MEQEEVSIVKNAQITNIRAFLYVNYSINGCQTNDQLLCYLVIYLTFSLPELNPLIKKPVAYFYTVINNKFAQQFYESEEAHQTMKSVACIHAIEAFITIKQAKVG